MVRVWLRPALVALRRQAAVNAQSSALKGASQQASATQQLLTVRAFSSKKDKHDKKKLSEKFVDVEEELTEIPPDVQYLSKETRDEHWGSELDPEFIKALQEGDLLPEEEGDSESDSEEETTEDEIAQLERMLADSDNDEEEFLEDGDEELSDAEWAAKYERELAKVDTGKRDVEDDRLYIEMPHRDSSLLMATEGNADDSDDESDDDDDNTPDTADPFMRWDQGMAYSPEMLNWMKPEAGKPMAPAGKDKPWKYFVRANHPDVVELAMDTDLLRLFIAPTGRIRPRRFTGLTAKQQRQVARAIKISRQMALLPYLSRYPDPSPAQWAAMEDEEIEASLAAMENEDDDDDDDDDDDEFEGMDDE